MKVFLSLLIVLGIGVVFFSWKNSKNLSHESISTIESVIAPKNVPFESMTIPYLRVRSYESTLGEIKPLVKKAEYSQYLTSYTSDGLRVNALLTKPNGKIPDGGWPAIVFVHGYIPPTLYTTTGKYVDYVDYLARNGFVVLKIDLRGHGESEGTPGGAYYSSDYVIDTLSAYNALTHTDFVNGNRIGLWGHSMAGNIVARSIAAQPTIKAAAIWAGAGYTYADLQQYRIHDNSYRPPSVAASQSGQQRAVFLQYGQFDPKSDFWKMVAPTNYLNDFTGALALYHAKDDDVVSIEYSRNLTAILDKTQVKHELHEYPTGGHNISGASFSQAMKSTVTFFSEHLSK